MSAGLKLTHIISLLVIITINTLFFYKFSVLYSGYPVLFSVLYILIFGSIIFLIERLNYNSPLFNKKLVISFTLIVISLSLYYVLFFPRLGELGRLPAIEDWIARFINGSFPYNSPNIPSSFPVIFLLAHPFYALGNTGLLSFAGIALLFFVILKSNDSIKSEAVKILIVVSSVVIPYELVTRSELLFNMMLVVLVITACEKYLNASVIDINFILTAILTGVVSATRLVTLFLFLIYLLYKFRYDLGKGLFFGLIAVAVFAVILLPFYLWDPQSFIMNGPFAVQSYVSNLPLVIIVLLGITAVYIGWIISDLQEFFFSGGIILFAAVTISFLLRVNEIGFYDAVINDGYDIAYFIFCIPLLILSIREIKSPA